MIELLRRAAEVEPDRAAIVGDERTLTYAEMAAWAEAIADALVERGITRFATATTDAAAVIAMLAGASLVGVDACQYPPTDGRPEIESMLDRFDHDVLVTDRADLADLPGAITVEQLAAPGTSGAARREIPTGLRPLMILTTGTTGLPRAARHDWNRLLISILPVKLQHDQRWLLAYGSHQFAGMQFLMHVMALGATMIAPNQRRPKDGLAAMRAHDVGYVSATPTWYRFLLAELAADGGPPPGLVQISLGGEAVPEPLLRRLREVFPDAKQSQIYGANEFGPSGSVRDGRSGLHASILERDDDALVQLKIVDGELWVRTKIGMLGYYGEEPVDPDDWRPTGDLVEVVGDRLHFRGRRSEIINVGGVKVHPLPVEEIVSAIPGVQFVRVFGRPNTMTGAIVAVEAVPEPGADTEELAGAIRAACADLPPASRPRSISFVDELAVRGGKLSRVSRAT